MEKLNIDVKKKRQKKESRVKPKIGRPGRDSHSATSMNPPKDKATRLYLREIEASIIQDMGGIEHCSNKELIQISSAMRIIHKLHCIEKWLMNQPAFINSKGEILPVLGSNYLAYISQLSRTLQSLGLKASAAKGPDLAGYLQAKQAKHKAAKK